MPVYDYNCVHGHTIEEHRKVSERNDPLPCPECGENMVMEIGAPHFGILKMGVDSGFPTFYEKWGKLQQSKNKGKVKDTANKDASDKTLAQAGLL
jgi:putative FmdB family regulatory protein